MFAAVVVIHVIACLVLIAVILLQAGRGGGLSELAGSNQTQSILGTQTNTFMTRATEICAVVFVITSLTLGIMSTQRGKSLMQRDRLIHDLKTSLPASTALPQTTAEELQKAMDEAKAAAAPAAEAAKTVEVKAEPEKAVAAAADAQ